MKVTVTYGIQVFHDGEVHRGGAELDVPESVARQWVRNGWASTDGPSSLPDPRGLNKTAHDEPESESSEDTATSSEDTATDDADDSSDEPAPAKARDGQRRAKVRRDPRRVTKGGNDNG